MSGTFKVDRSETTVQQIIGELFLGEEYIDSLGNSIQVVGDTVVHQQRVEGWDDEHFFPNQYKAVAFAAQLIFDLNGYEQLLF